MPGQSSRSHHKFAHAIQMEETVYVYSNTVYAPPETYVNGYGDVTATGGSYGHEYTPRITMYGPGSSQYLSTDGSSLPMELCNGNDCYDGLYTTFVTALVFCPILNGTYETGNSDSSDAVARFIRVNGFGSFSPNPVTHAALSISVIGLSITASSTTSTQVTIEPSYIVSSGSPPIDIASAVDGGSTFTINQGNTVSRTIIYNPKSVTTNPTRVKAEAMVSAFVNVINNNPNSASILTINK